MLEPLYSGRVDAGIGNSVGFTAPVRTALRQPNDQKALAELKRQFPDDLRELLAYLDDAAPITARPRNDARTSVWLLAGFRSLLIAAELGLPVIMCGVSSDAIASYFNNFVPSSRSQGPTLVLSRTVAVADTEQQARDLVLPEIWAQVVSRSTGSFDGLQPVADLRAEDLTPQERTRIAEQLKLAIYGTPGQVKEQLADVLKSANGTVTEILISVGMSDLSGQCRSEELLAQIAEDGISRAG